MGLLRYFQNNEKEKYKPVEPEQEPSTVTSITATKGEYEGVTIEFDTQIIIGRDPSVSELIIDDSNVSRKHCCIHYNPKEKNYTITDYSTNGTFVGRERVEKFSNLTVPGGSFVIIGQSGNNFRLN